MVRKTISIIAIFLVIGFLYINHTLYSQEEFFSDQLIKEEKEVRSDTKLLTIDDESLSEIGKWPWPRSIIAEVSDKLALAGAKAIFIDVLFTEPSQDQTQDNILQEVVKKHDNIFLASNFVLENRLNTETNKIAVKSFHMPAIDTETAQIGHINVIEDDDRVVRHVMLGIQNTNGEMIPAISVKLANMTLEEDEMVTWDKKTNQWYKGNEVIPVNNKNEVRFAYATEPHEDSLDLDVIKSKFDTQSIYKVINGDFPPEYFADSIVLIGPYAIGLQDVYTTPMSKKTKMFGVEIHANIVQSLIDGDYYTKAPKPLSLSIIGLMTIISFLTIDRFSAKWGFFIFAALLGLYLVSVRIIYTEYQLLLPFFYIILLLIITYITSIVSQYIVERKEKARVTNLFGRYVSKGVVDEILSTQEEVKLGGIRKEVTLVFVDIRGFTPLSEKMEPEKVILILNEYLELCTRAVFEYEGTLDKFIGDGVMAIFGAPIEQPDHAERAVRAALRMKENADDLARRVEKKYGRTIGFGIGVNSGPAVIGNIGSHDRLDYTAIGDTVNLAARLEANAKPGQILISEHTFEYVKDRFKIDPLEAIKVKGKEKPVTIYQVQDSF